MLASYHHTWLGRHAMKPLGCETPLSWRCATIRINEEMAAAASWAAKLKLHNQKHPPAPKTEGNAYTCQMHGVLVCICL